MHYAILKAVIVESLEFPLALNAMLPAVPKTGIADMRKFPAGVAKNPDSEMEIHVLPTLGMSADAEAITVVPSHNLASICAPVLFTIVIVPDANHVPTEPCATDGPVK